MVKRADKPGNGKARRQVAGIRLPAAFHAALEVVHTSQQEGGEDDIETQFEGGAVGFEEEGPKVVEADGLNNVAGEPPSQTEPELDGGEAPAKNDFYRQNVQLFKSIEEKMRKSKHFDEKADGAPPWIREQLGDYENSIEAGAGLVKSPEEIAALKKARDEGKGGSEEVKTNKKMSISQYMTNTTKTKVPPEQQEAWRRKKEREKKSAELHKRHKAAKEREKKEQREKARKEREDKKKKKDITDDADAVVGKVREDAEQREADEKLTIDNLPSEVTKSLSVNYYKKIKQKSNYVFAVAFLGIILLVVEHELLWRNDFNHNIYTYGLKTLISISTLCLLILQVFHYRDMAAQMVHMNQLPPGSRFWSSPSLLREFILEMIALSYHIPPGVGDFTFEVRDGIKYPFDIFGLFMFVRFYLFTTLVRNFSGIFTQNAAFFGSYTNVKITTSFAVKAFLNNKPFTMLVPAYAVSVSTISWWIYLCERGYNDGIENYWDCIWLTFITMMTVGYGDVSPVTDFGKVVTFGSSFTGVILVALITAVVFKNIELSLDEHRVTDMLERASYNIALRKSAQKVIKRAWDHYYVRTSRGGRRYNHWIIDRKHIKLYSALNTFRKMKRSNPYTEKSDLKSQMNVILEVKRKQDDLLTRMKELENKLNNIVKELVGATELTVFSATELHADKTVSDHKLIREDGVNIDLEGSRDDPPSRPSGLFAPQHPRREFDPMDVQASTRKNNDFDMAGLPIEETMENLGVVEAEGAANDADQTFGPSLPH